MYISFMKRMYNIILDVLFYCSHVFGGTLHDHDRLKIWHIVSKRHRSGYFPIFGNISKSDWTNLRLYRWEIVTFLLYFLRYPAWMHCLVVQGEFTPYRKYFEKLSHEFGKKIYLSGMNKKSSEILEAIDSFVVGFYSKFCH